MGLFRRYLLTPLFRNGARAKRVSGFITPWLSNGQRVLDLGCGNLLVGKHVQEGAGVRVTGVDVIDINQTPLPLTLYDGKEIPFDERSFDVTYAAFILHHTEDVRALLAECIRVTKGRLLVLEDVYRNGFELGLTRALDYNNKLVAPEMPLPLNFMREREWLALFEQLGTRLVGVKNVRPVPMRPTRHRLFVLDLA